MAKSFDFKSRIESYSNRYFRFLPTSTTYALNGGTSSSSFLTVQFTTDCKYQDISFNYRNDHDEVIINAENHRKTTRRSNKLSKFNDLRELTERLYKHDFKTIKVDTRKL